jgi:hypothetical protein
MNTTPLWETLGSLEEDQAFQVLTLMFTRFEKRWEIDPADPEARSFFQGLEVAMAQVQSCNISRR